MNLSETHKSYLRTLDGAWSPVTFPGHRHNIIRSLARKGLVTYHTSRGGILLDDRRTYYHVSLTTKGSDFIYNGGVDY